MEDKNMKKHQIAAVMLAAVLSVGSFAAPASVVPGVIEAEAVSASGVEIPAPENIVGKVSKDSIVLTWDKVDDADAYRVYMYNAETKKYEKYKTVSGTKCTVTSLESGKTYYFKVASLVKTGSGYMRNGISSKVSVKMTGSDSTASEASTLSAPKNISGKASKDSIVLTWDKVNGADAYRVYMYNAETKKFEKYKTVSGTKCTVTSLESGKTYYFKVATLTKSGKSYVLNETSSKVSFKTSASTSSSSSKKKTVSAWDISMLPSEKYLDGMESEPGDDNGMIYYCYFTNPKYIDKYIKELESMGCKIEKTTDDDDIYIINVYDTSGKKLIAIIMTMNSLGYMMISTY
ncbi:MAG: fibronectin type III domain-containing protein [Huintestinicola sp.]